jgi:hypothetical protein
LTTGYSEIFLKDDGLDRELAFISKPYRKHDLAAKVRAVLDATDDREDCRGGGN